MIRMPAILLPLLPLLFLICCSVDVESRADIVDQEQLVGSTSFASDGGFFNVQSFQQAANNITGASVSVLNVPTGTPITIRLYGTSADTSNPNLALAQGTVVTSSTSATTPQFESVVFTGGPVSVTPGQTLFLAFEKATGPGGTVQGAQGIGGFQGSLSNPYPDGQLFSEGTAFANFDYAFQTFAVDPASVPEPSSLSLFGVWFAILMVTHRRR